MLSILIPCYNYSCVDLVTTLHHQCTTQHIEFEILVSEDGGNQFIEQNSQINSLHNSTYLANKLNLGRAGNINRLLHLARFKAMLILDCDLKPKNNTFVSNYLQLINDNRPLVCFGGIQYEKSEEKHNLRYNYGIKREAILAKDRAKNPYKSLLTSNLLLVNCQQEFDDRISTYGYEDLVFAEELKQKSIPVQHIDNQLLHLNVEENLAYLKKTEEALQTLIKLENEGFVQCGLTRISSIHNRFKKNYLNFTLSLLYVFFKTFLVKTILRKGRPLWMFDLYKLLYFNKYY